MGRRSAVGNAEGEVGLIAEGSGDAPFFAADEDEERTCEVGVVEADRARRFVGAGDDVSTAFKVSGGFFGGLRDGGWD
jgi:hypothetical protein